VQPLGGQNRAAFHCGEKELDSYFLERASRDVREKISAVFVLLTEEDKSSVFGYYTLSNQEIDAGELPSALTKKTGNYRRLPATLIRRLAVSETHRGRRLGEFLLIDGLKRALESTANVMSFAVFVDAKGQQIIAFYEKYGFIRLSGTRLYVPMKTIEKTFGSINQASELDPNGLARPSSLLC
jgi:predicted N-acetyltransferase YhbS